MADQPSENDRPMPDAMSDADKVELPSTIYNLRADGVLDPCKAPCEAGRPVEQQWTLTTAFKPRFHRPLRHRNAC